MAASIEQLGFEISAAAGRPAARSTPGAVLALIGFSLCLWVLLPHRLVFAFRGDALLAASDSRNVIDVSEAYRVVTGWIGPGLDANGQKLGDLSDWFTVSCVLLAAEVILWTVSLSGQPRFMATATPKTTPAPRPPAQLPTAPPPGFAIPEERGGLLGREQPRGPSHRR